MFTNYIKENIDFVHKELTRFLNSLPIPQNLKKSMLYSVEAGGKRLRPILLLASYEAFKKEDEKRTKIISSMAALEMIHTYSLIHDDLPAMDDDDLRRGKPTNHKVFDEATAILAGDALLTYSFEIIAKDSLLTDAEKVRIIQMLSSASGPKGMVGGQILDMEAEKRTVSLEEMENIHDLKTGELLKFAVGAGAFLGNATEEQIKELKNFAYYLGLIFQVQDDILDIIGDENKIGKATGSDELNEKSTYPKLLGLEGATKKKDDYVQKAKLSLLKVGIEDSPLSALTDYFSVRDY
nr:farnesyl diphosphate synthase [Ornithinibacillus halophilus]